METQTRSNEQSKDKQRFTQAINKAMQLVSRHPNAETTSDAEGKPVSRSLVEDVRVRGGDARLAINIGPSSEPRHPNQPATTITLTEKFDTFIDSASGNGQIQLAPVTRLNFYGDGTIEVTYSERSTQPDDQNAEGSYESIPHSGEYSGVHEFEMHIDNMSHSDASDPSGYDDWDHVRSIEEAIEALAIQAAI